MAGKPRPLTPELWAALLTAFREMPGNVLRASKQAGCSRDTADKAWKEGWKRKPYAQKPIRDLLEEEQEAARFERYRREREAAEKLEEQRLKAREDAVAARADEAMMTKVGRGNALNLAAVAGYLVGASVKAVQHLATRVDDATSGRAQALTLAELRDIIRLAHRTTESAARVLHLAVELERVVTGNPVKVIGLEITGANLTPELITAELASVTRTMMRASRLANPDDVAKYLELAAGGAGIEVAQLPPDIAATAAAQQGRKAKVVEGIPIQTDQVTATFGAGGALAQAQSGKGTAKP